MGIKLRYTIIFFIFYKLLANPLDTLKPLLVDLQGWNAGPAGGAISNQNNIQMITASRLYSNIDRQFQAVLVFTNQLSQMPWLDTEMQFDISSLSVETEMINGYQVFQASRNSGSEILIVVVIRRNTEDGLFLVLNFRNITKEIAWEVAEKFDWDTIKFLTQTIQNE